MLPVALSINVTAPLKTQLPFPTSFELPFLINITVLLKVPPVSSIALDVADNVAPKFVPRKRAEDADEISNVPLLIKPLVKVEVFEPEIVNVYPLRFNVSVVIVRLATVLAWSSKGCRVVEGMVTSSLTAGGPDGDQLEAVAQLVEVLPVHV
jgi:hypothetical protein